MASGLKWKNKRLIAVQNTELTNLPAEIWKDIPGFPGYKISCFGRVKSLRKNQVRANGTMISRNPRILKLRDIKINKSSNNAIVLMNLFKDDKVFAFSVARMVYHVFVKPFDLEDKSLLIVKKDGDYLNCHYKNLELKKSENSRVKLVKSIKRRQKAKGDIPLLADTIESLEGEIWKTIPDLNERYLISNFGRVKSLKSYDVDKNGKVVLLRGKMNKIGVMVDTSKRFAARITLKKNETFVTISIPRTVYYVFNKQFDLSDKSLVVTFTDGNPLNCYYKNLELKTTSRLKADLFKKNGNEAYTKSRLKTVHQYDKEGKYINTYASAKEAALKTGISLMRIQNAIYRKQLQDKQYYWQTEKKRNKIDISFYSAKAIKNLQAISRPVQQFSQEGKLLKTYASLSEATKAMGFKSTNSIAQVCKGETSSSGGYRWQYDDSVPYRAQLKAAQPVYQYNLKGIFLKEYPSAGVAAKSIGIVPSAIGNAVRLKHKTAKGFYWRSGIKQKKIDVGGYKIKQKQHLLSGKKMVHKFSLEGKFIKTYSSLIEAANDVKTSPGSIKRACGNPQFICSGHHWRLTI